MGQRVAKQHADTEFPVPRSRQSEHIGGCEFGAPISMLPVGHRDHLRGLIDADIIHSKTGEQRSVAAVTATQIEHCRCRQHPAQILKERRFLRAALVPIHLEVIMRRQLVVKRFD